MGDYAKKPKNYKRGRCLEFERICREEREAGATVVVASVPAVICTASFPCLAHIMVLAGLEQPCAACAPNLQKARDAHGYRQEGTFWITDQITEEQQQFVRGRIARRTSEQRHECAGCGGTGKMMNVRQAGCRPCPECGGTGERK